MRATHTGYIGQNEWRWVIVVSCGLALIAVSPFLLVALRGFSGGAELMFMGALHDFTESAGNLARMAFATQHGWLAQYLHTPEPHNGALIDPLYVLLGHISRFTGVSIIVIYHIARICAAIFMYLSLYYLAGSIWMRLRTRRIFFLLVAMGSGFGWLFGGLSGDTAAFIDLNAASAFPFHSTLSNVHGPLAIACLALLASAVVNVARPDETPTPTVNNGGVVVFCIGLLLVFLYPVAFLPISLAFALTMISGWVSDKAVNDEQVSWLMWFIVPSLPILMYYLIVLRTDPIISAIWLQEIQRPPPALPAFIVSLGLPLMIAIPGLYRAARRFERDGDQFMFIWLITIVLAAYLPTGAQASFLVGITIPLMYFATRAIEDVWVNLVKNVRWQVAVAAVALPLVFLSNLFVLVAPLVTIYGDEADDQTILLQREYVEALAWLGTRVEPDDVILAAPAVSLWIPVWTGATVVYGHPTQSIEPEPKRQAVEAWYAATTCTGGLLDEADYIVGYVIYGPLERELGAAACRDDLRLIRRFGDVSIYRNPAAEQ